MSNFIGGRRRPNVKISHGFVGLASLPMLKQSLRKAFDLKERHAQSVAFRKKVISGAVHIGRPEAKPTAAALDRINKLAVEALSVGQDGGKELGGMVTLEPGCLVGFDAVGGAVSSAKCVSLETTDQLPYGLDFIGCPARCLGGCDKLTPDLDYALLLALDQCSAQDVGASG